MFLRIILLAATLALSSCFLTPHRIDVQQGNYFDPEAVARLKPGMTRSQVRFLLGTPLIADPFHPDRWDYLFIDRRAGKLKEERRLTLWFDGDRLIRAATDVPDATPAPAAARAASASTAAQSGLDSR